MDKQTVMAFVLIGVILVVWLYMNSPEPQPQQPKSADTTAVTQEKPKIEKPKIEKKETVTPPIALPDTALVFGERLKEKIITIETDLVKLELTSKGAKIRKYYLKEFKTWYHNDLPDSSDFYKRHVQLINNSFDNGDLNLIFVSNDGKLINTSNVYFTSNLNNYYYRISDGDSLVVDFTSHSAGNRSIVKRFVFYADNYASRFEVELRNMHDLISSYRYDVNWSNGLNFIEKNSVDEANYSNASAYSGEEQVIIDASTPGEKTNKDMNGKVDWISVKNKYFAMALSPDDPSHEGGAYFEGTAIENQWGKREYYSASLKIPFKNQNFQKNSFQLYLGPVDYDLLKSYHRNYEALYDFGSLFGLTILIRPISEYVLLPLFQFLHLFIPNYGFVIIVFSMIIKFALYPLTKQSYKSMKKMQLLQPKIKELKEKYKDDQQRVQKETMSLYKTYGVNPAGGCLPMLLQMPILIALWSLFKVAIELRQEPFIWWINNLADPDVIYHLSFKLPIVGVDQISGLAILLGVTMFFQQKMSVKDPSQKAMVYVMPVMFTLMFMGFPAGLNLYYFMFNLFSIAQQQWINTRKDDAELVPVAKGKQKSGFMQRMMEAAEQQKKAQKQTGKKKRKF